MRHAFTLKELLVVMFIISASLFILAPGMVDERGFQRRIQCQNNVKQLVLAMHNYYDTFGHFPSAMGGTGAGGNKGRRSGLVDLLPMMEQSALYDAIMLGDAAAGIPPGGPVPWDRNYPLWQTRVETLQCPASRIDKSDFQATNYAFCIGDVSVDIHQLPQLRGAFAPGLTTTFKKITDGTSNSIALAEMGTIRERDVPGQYAIDLPPNVLTDPAIALRMVSRDLLTYRREVALHKYGRGYNWADGAAGPGLVNTILPPNGPSCAVGGSGAVDGIYSAGSYHPGGVLVGMCDGSARFITDKIDCGNASAAPPTADGYAGQTLASPFGVWGALGTINGGEIVTDDDY